MRLYRNMKMAQLNNSQKQILLKIAREAIEAKLQGLPLPKYEINDLKLNEKPGVFVTLTRNGELRGCIGAFYPQTPLWQTVQKMAAEAAFNDPRFPPVNSEELKDIEIEISVLSKPKKINDWQKIKLGKHGVIIKYQNRTGTFLPQVAEETDWTLEQFLSQLCSQKCGLPPDAYKNPNTEIFVYEVKKIN